MTSARQRRTPRNLQAYWQMEGANVVLVPGAAFALGFPHDWLDCIALLFAIAAAGGFLVVGAAYWRGVDRRVRLRDRASTARSLELAACLQVPLVVVLIAAVALAIAAWWSTGWARAVIAATVLNVLALLEYVNYYHVQLQNFDHAADLRRLLTRPRLRRSHMARDLRAARAPARSAGEGVVHQDGVVPLG